MKLYYFKHLIKRFKRYIFYYFKYQLNQTKRHAFYENLKSNLSFFLIIINFILRFSFFENEFNIIIILTNKFNKKSL